MTQNTYVWGTQDVFGWACTECPGGGSGYTSNRLAWCASVEHVCPTEPRSEPAVSRETLWRILVTTASELGWSLTNSYNFAFDRTGYHVNVTPERKDHRKQ